MSMGGCFVGALQEIRGNRIYNSMDFISLVVGYASASDAVPVLCTPRLLLKWVGGRVECDGFNLQCIIFVDDAIIRFYIY